MKGNPNLACEGQTNTLNKEVENKKYKTKQDRSILYKQNKEIEAEKVELGFWTWVRVHIHRVYVRSPAIYVRMQEACMYAYTPKTLTQKYQEQKTEQKVVT